MVFKKKKKKSITYFSRTRTEQADICLPLYPYKDHAGLSQTINKGRKRKFSPLGNPLLQRREIGEMVKDWIMVFLAQLLSTNGSEVP